MKKFYLAAAACLVMLTAASCSKGYTITATDIPVAASVQAISFADIQVGERMTYRYNVPSADRKTGFKNCKAAAIAAMLKAAGNADILIGAEYYYDNDLKFIEVSGRPGKYVNFRNAN